MITSQGTKWLFLVQIPLSVWHVWMNFKSSRSLISICMIKSWWKIQWENYMGGTSKNIAIDGDTWSIRGQVRCWILRLIQHIGKISFRSIFIVFIDYKKNICRRVEGGHILNGIETLHTWRICYFSLKKYSLPSFLPCSSNSSRCSFVIFFTLALAWFLISALSLYFYLLQYLMKFSWRDVSVLHCLWMILVMLSYLLWVSSLMHHVFLALQWRL